MIFFFLLLLWPGMSQFGPVWREVVGAGCCWQGWLWQGRKHRLLSWPHRCWNKCFSDRNTCICYFTCFLGVAITHPPCWPFSTESRLIKVQINYYMQIKKTGVKTWFFRELWKLLSSADLFSLHFLCSGPILHDLVVQWSDSCQCCWCKWCPCIWGKWFLLGRLTMCPGLWWTVCRTVCSTVL